MEIMAQAQLCEEGSKSSWNVSSSELAVKRDPRKTISNHIDSKRQRYPAKTVTTHERKAIAVYDRFKRQGTRPSIAVVLDALKECRSKRDMEAGRRIHRDMLETGDFSNIFVRNVLGDLYAKCGSLPDARAVFESANYRDIVSWNSIILAYARAGDAETALELFSRLQREKTCQQNSVTLLAALKACARLAEQDQQQKCLEQVRAIHSVALNLGRRDGHSELGLFLASNLVHMYARCGSMDEACRVFHGMKRHDVVSWTAIILGYAHTNEAERALEFFDLMQARGFVPDRITVLATLKACAVLAEKEESRLLAGRFVKVECLKRGRAIHAQATQAGVERDTVLATALVDMYAKCGSLVEARQVFDGMIKHDLVSWTAIIAGHAQSGDGELAMEFFSRMKDQGCAPDAITFVAVLKACGSLAAVESGKRVEAELRSAGLETNLIVANALVDFYGKCGCMEEAKKVFDSISKKDLVSWSSLIAGYGSQGDTKNAFELFERMQKEEHLKPDEITFLSVLTACNHAGLVEEGKKYFETFLRSSDRMKPTLQHYTCMIDLFGRANQLEKAVALLNSMPFSANEVTWTTVLSSARKWRNVGVGRMAFESLVKLDAKSSSAYILMSNIFASLEMWEEAAKVRAMRKQAGAWKKPGQSSWTDNSGRVHKFLVGDTRHPQTREIQSKLDHLLNRMKDEAGYVPRLYSALANVPDDDKESALCGHSEKLAIACALINTDPKTTIRIVKNLRVCDDCHEATALISKLENRTIVCRDAIRFHTFARGSCSCGNFW